jgi:small-conductance mechanosensitive channel
MLPAVPWDLEAVRVTALQYATRTFWALVVVAVALLLARLVRRTTMRALARHRAHANATILLGNAVQILILVLGALVVLAIFTAEAFGWVLTSLGVLGLVIGLSLQDILKNYFAGVWILVERPFSIGDTVALGEHSGEVTDITFRTTLLRTAEGRQVILPNSLLMTDPVVNFSR